MYAASVAATDARFSDDESTSLRRARFAVADLVRLIAILSVFACHLLQATRPVFLGRSHDFRYLGSLGVETFFCLSGYLLAGPFLRWILQDEARPSIRLFLVRRFLRIVPLYAIAVLVSALFDAAAAKPPTVLDVLVHLFLLQDFSVALVQSLNGPLWTMPVDGEFYLALPVFAVALAALTARLAPDRRRPGMLLALALVIATSILYRYLAVSIGHVGFDDAYFVFVDNGIGMASAFAIGIGLAFSVEFPHALGRRVVPVGVAGALGVLLYSRLLATTASSVSVQTTLGAFSVAALLYALPFWRPVVRLALARTTATGAAMAYAIYLIHYPVMRFFVARLHVEAGNRGFVELAIATSVVVFPLAYLLHRYVEAPILIIKNRQRERTPATTSGALCRSARVA